MSDKNIRIAILDDGVHPKACPLAGSFLIDNDLSVSSQKENTVSPYSHGSMCARIVQRYTRLDKVDVFSLQILQGNTLRGNIDRLLKSLELCVSMDIRLIHLSVGTYVFEDFAKLEEAVHFLAHSDRFLVAATGNQGTVTYPAYLPGVIGVKCHPKLSGDEYIYSYDSFTKIHFQASARHNLSVDGQEMKTSMSNSYAAPLITAKLLSYLKNNKDLGKNDILCLLMKNAKKNIFAEKSESYPSVDIPVVVLSGFSTKRLSCIIGHFTNCLRREDYHVRVATNLSGVRPWDETVLPETEDLDLFTARMAWYFSCEIILLGSTSYIAFDNYENVSLWIYGEESSIVPEVDESERQDIVVDDDEIGNVGVNGMENGEIQVKEVLDDVQVFWAAGMDERQMFETMIDILK